MSVHVAADEEASVPVIGLICVSPVPGISHFGYLYIFLIARSSLLGLVSSVSLRMFVLFKNSVKNFYTFCSSRLKSLFK